MKRTLAALALLALAAVLFFVPRGDERGPEAVRGADGATSDAPTASASPLAATDATSERTSVVEAAPATLTDAAAAELAAEAATDVDDPRLAHIRGIVLQHDGTPAADAKLVVRGWGVSGERAQRHGTPTKPWQDVVAVTNADGSFDVAFDPPGAYQFVFEIAAAWAPMASWRWGEVPPGSVIDLGTIELPLGGRVEGRIVRHDGSPAGGVWTVATEDSAHGMQRYVPEQRISTQSDPDDSTFVFEGLAPGFFEIKASTLLAEPVLPQVVKVVAGRTSSVTFVHAGPPLERKLALSFTHLAAGAFAPPRREHVHLRTPQGNEIANGTVAAELPQGYRGGLVFEDLEPGAYVIAIDDPRFEPFVSEPLVTGRQHALALRGSVALTLCVTADGRALDDASFTVRPLVGEKGKSVFAYATPIAHDVPGEYLFATAPEAQVWYVAAHGFEAGEVEFPAGFELGSEQRVVVELEPAIGISGRVLDANGAPLAGAKVTAHLARDTAADANASSKGVFVDGNAPRVHTTTAADGTYWIGPLDAPAYDLVTDHPPAVCGFALAVPARSEGVDLVLAPHGSLSGRITPDFKGRADVGLVFRHTQAGARLPMHLTLLHRFAGAMSDFDAISVSADGTFRADFQPVGAHELALTTGLGEFTMGDSTTSVGDSVMKTVPYTIAAGATTELVVDLSNEAPRSARIHVDLTTESTSLLRVIGLKHTTTHDGSQHWFITAEGTLDDDGWAEVWPITPGRWRFELRPYDAPWAWPIGDEVDIDGATEFERRVTVELVRARVAVVAPSGAPAANQSFLIPLDGMSTSLRSNAAGELEFEMPPGTYTLKSSIKAIGSNSKPVPAQPIELVWTREGPAEPVLVLRPVE
jgi:hypothetical protein